MILTLARGHYCPKEHQQHLELAAFFPKVNVGYARIATIATDEHHTLQDWDLSTPGLREAWDAGDVAKFHGWARRAGARRGCLIPSSAVPFLVVRRDRRRWNRGVLAPR